MIFFLYVNGKWRKRTAIPADKSRWGSFDVLREESVEALREILDELAGKKKNFDFRRTETARSISLRHK